MFLDLLVKLILTKGFGNNFKLVFFFFNSGIVDNLSFILQHIERFFIVAFFSSKNLCQELFLIFTDLRLDLSFQLYLELLKEFHLLIHSLFISFDVLFFDLVDEITDISLLFLHDFDLFKF